MLNKLFRRFFGSRNDRYLRKCERAVAEINALEPAMQALSEDELRAKTDEFRARLKDGAELDDLLAEAFAVVREAGRRYVEMRHFDVQLIGGMVLHEGRIAEMRTGEGKTLVATLAAYLNALPEDSSVHVVTVNDYLARRDAQWMGRIYERLGMSVGVVVPGQDAQAKRAAYGADIIYGTNNEFGFDYLRDNMAFRAEERAQRSLDFAIVDEVDSILIDEARTPLIISGPADDNTELYVKVDKLVPNLKREEDETDPGDYTVDEKTRQVYLTEQGHEKVEGLLQSAGLLKEGESLYDAANIQLMHHINAALRAHALYKRDVEYVVSDDGEIVIVDEFTGRTMPGRRWSEGLHQAVEAKEGVKIRSENQTLASITFQNFFRLYDKLSGMTGTADTEAFEFQSIYGLEVIVIPTNKPMIRADHPDLVFLTAKEKFNAIIEDIKDCRERGQPVLVGTASIDTSEYLSKLLDKEKISHQVLNAKQHEREAEIIAQAGRPGSVTIATNMAGRGTDIVLGGSLDAELENIPERDAAAREKTRAAWQERHRQVVEAGGLHIIGSERHESRRIDNQLRGRSGRQGDPGSSRFYLSMEDNLMRIFGAGRVSNLLRRLGVQEGEAIEHSMVTKQIEQAQRKVEAHNFDIRKQLLEYDDVANDQRKVIYEQRNELMQSEDVADVIENIREDVVNSIIDTYVPPNSLDEMWDIAGLEEALERDLAVKLPIQQWLDEDDTLAEEGLRERVLEEVKADYEKKLGVTGEKVMRHFEKAVMLQVLDQLWKEHLAAMDYLRQGIHLRGYAQRNPKQEYKREAFQMFTDMLERLKHEVITIICKVQVRAEEDVQAMEEKQQKQPSRMHFQHEDAQQAAAASAGGQQAASGQAAPATPQTYVRNERKVGRNDPCPCGSGKKYKHCHGKLA